ncbi:MAG: NERD domain-containing protein [Clostridia bacterium]|nr:NERD domain-containing protein [Clostridia bacterium]
MINEIINKLTNKFTETVFCKKSSDLEDRIKALEILLKKYPNNEKLMNELNICKIGLQGEKEIEFELSNANVGMYVLHDVNMVYQDLKAQIDYIIITAAYTYFVECKRISGNIFVDASGNFNRAYMKDGKKVIEGMYSPLSQAQRHIEIFKKIWADRNTSILDQTVRLKNFDRWYKPLVVFANPKNTIDLRNAPEDYKDKIIKSENLVELLKKEYQSCDKDYLISKKDMELVAYSIMTHYNRVPKIDYISRYEEMISTTKNDVEDSERLKEELLSYREQKSKSRHISESYVFMDDELEIILKVKPKTKEELVKANILPEVKVRYHGEEIVNIIVSYSKAD